MYRHCLLAGEVRFDGGIFFWEEIGLTPRQIDQLLTALVNIGFMDRISAMIVGDFFASESEQSCRSNPLDSVMNAISSYNFPVVYAPSFGHKPLENPIFPIGALASFNPKSFSLCIEEPVLS
jgi:muramoyltetrapeptide carboxypeptidase LdcA involved in peptidoglycan recycling